MIMPTNISMNKDRTSNSVILAISILNIPFFMFSSLMITEAVLDQQWSMVALFSVYTIALGYSFYFIIQKSRNALWINIILLCLLPFIFLGYTWKDVLNIPKLVIEMI